MMRLEWYAGASTVLATGVVLSAFHQRANFYSAMVYLFQSNLCMMILVNLIALIYSTFVYSLQRVCFGQLRAVEVEQLYEKAWFAVTETCLAMTMFRDEIGGFFIVMFVALLTGKVWGWIGEGRIEALEQQPPANPRLFHTRLIISLCLSLVYDAWLLYYAVSTVIDQAKSDMMVMFLFEFAVLLVTSLHTALRYGIILLDISIIKRQTQERLVERRREIREERAAIIRRREEAAAAAEAAAATGQEGGEGAVAALETEEDNEPLPDEDDVDEMDIEVAGWEAKGQYILGLDLWTDFTKLCIYAVFFIVLLNFYGLPLHIIRDLFMTVRSFIKRLGALMKYRQAIKDMNRYEDASEQDLARENTCIICREDMHVWNQNDPARIERTRPKKLPCGHILHLGCLKSWMERQQVCPTCRRSVVIDDASNAHRNRDNALFRLNLVAAGAAGADPAGAGVGAAAGAGGVAGAPPAANGANPLQNPALPAVNGQAPAPGAAAGAPGHGADANHHNPHPPPPPNGGGGGGPALRMFNIGPLRLGFAQGGARDIQEMAQRLGLPNAIAGGNPPVNNQAAPAGVAGGPPAFGATPTPFAHHVPHATPTSTMSQSTSTASIFQDLRSIERRIELGTIELQLASAEARALRTMLTELQRIRNTEHTPTTAREPTLTVPVDPTGPADPSAVAATDPVAQSTGAAPDASATNATERAPAQAPQEDAPATSSSSAAPDAPDASSSAEQERAALNQAESFFRQWPGMDATLDNGSNSGPDQGAAVGAGGLGDEFGNVPPVRGNSELPPGVQLPPGWSLVPLDQYDPTRRTTTDNDGNSQPGPSNNRVTSQPNPSRDSLPADSREARINALASPLASTVEAVPESNAPAATSAAPMWGGSAQLYGSSSQTTPRATQTQQQQPQQPQQPRPQQNDDESSSESSEGSSEDSSNDS
ncbi:ring finger protein [Sporothrix brasiliensis 5110]|uniref:RING-type E3 ubiquitin transferase n=1 Tax=Sporothrix brasiliensis 5110 TaxID=1398154 RepID=A0A0C2IHJ5_9PEZI|nr:ring finger protein [Sporothrix brasiliensis 5110]KIH88626.1 ring finger protein [Sporothrix brasiliensis 5110]